MFAVFVNKYFTLSNLCNFWSKFDRRTLKRTVQIIVSMSCFKLNLIGERKNDRKVLKDQLLKIKIFDKKMNSEE